MLGVAKTSIGSKKVSIRSSPDIRWKFYKNTANSRTKKENIKIYENRMLSE